MQHKAEMSYCHRGFDPKAARETLSRATERPNVTTDIYHLAALTYLPAALDEIERLQADNQKWREYNLQLDRKNRKQRAALKKLGQAKRERGKALVEERAECNAVKIALGHPIAYAGFGDKERIAARQQLRQEGKL